MTQDIHNAGLCHRWESGGRGGVHHKELCPAALLSTQVTLTNATSSQNSIIFFPCFLSGFCCISGLAVETNLLTPYYQWEQPSFWKAESLFSGSISYLLDIDLLRVKSFILRTIQSSVLNFNLILNIILLLHHYLLVWCLLLLSTTPFVTLKDQNCLKGKL